MTDPKASEVRLKLCPFCGGSARHIERSNPMSKWRHSIDCDSSTCGMSGPVEATKAEAIASWNLRPAPTDADVQRVAKAICRADPEVRMGDAVGVVEQRVDVEWPHYVWQARAALAAMGGSDGTD